MDQRLVLAMVATLAAASVSAADSGVGQYSSITIGRDGRPLISYSDAANDDVKVARCRDGGCADAAVTVLDRKITGAGHTSIAIGPDGLPLVGYHVDGLSVAHCEDRGCTRKRITTVDGSPGGGGHFISLAFGADGLGLMSYRNYWSGQLSVAHCEDRACTRATTTLLEPGACCVGRNSALAIGIDGLGLIVYYDEKHGLCTAHCGDVACRTASIHHVMPRGFVGDKASLAIGPDGFALVSFSDQRGLVVAHCRDVRCTGFDSQERLDGNIWAQDTALAFGADGLPIVAYTETLGSLGVAHCNDLLCRGASLTAVTPFGMTFSPSLAIGRDGFGLVSFWDGTDDSLKVARCHDSACRSTTVVTVDGGGAR